MVIFSGYKLISDNPKVNDKENVLLFLNEVPQIFREFGSNDGFNIFQQIREDYLDNYKTIKEDFDLAFSESKDQLQQEIFLVNTRFVYQRDSRNARFGHWRLRAVGLTNNSLKLKLETNRANWASFERKRINRTTLTAADKDDAKDIIDLTRSIVKSVFSAFGIGEGQKELLDLLKVIMSKMVTLSDD